MFRIFSILLGAFLITASVALAGTSQPWEKIRNVCVDLLHDPAKATDILSRQGWRKFPSNRSDEFALVQNFLHTGLDDKKGVILLSPDESELFMFGPSDNQIYPNNKCLYSTSDRSSDVLSIIGNVNKLMAPITVTSATGKKFGNSVHEWMLGTFDRNISEKLRVNHVIVQHFPKKVSTTTAFFNIAIVGMSKP